MRCAGGRTVRWMGSILQIVGLGSVVACSSGTAVWAGFAALSVTSPLLRGLSQEVEVTCRIAPERAADVTAVTADLSQIGGPIIRPLERIDDDDWGWSGRLIPQEAGERTVTYRATLDDGTFYSQTETVLVNDPDGGGGGGGGNGDNLPPEVTDEALTTTGIVGVRGATTLSCTATDQDGTVESVVADLSAINGPDDAALTHGDGDTWSWTGDLTPLEEGDLTVPIVATDDDGATGTGEATSTIGPGFTLSIGPDVDEVDIFDDDPRTFTATITPAPPAGAAVEYHWTVSTFYLGQLVQTLRLPDAADPMYGQSLDTDENTLRVLVMPQPWNPRLRVPMESSVTCGATVTLPVGEAAAPGGRAELTVTQQGLEVTADLNETIETDLDGVVHRRFEAGFQWPKGSASMWVLAFLDRHDADQTVFNSIWMLPQVTEANGERHNVDDGNVGLELDERRWSSDGATSILEYQQRCQELRDIYTGWRAKVTGWPP